MRDSDGPLPREETFTIRRHEQFRQRWREGGTRGPNGYCFPHIWENGPHADRLDDPPWRHLADPFTAGVRGPDGPHRTGDAPRHHRGVGRSVPWDSVRIATSR